jgi:hypothetical protein
MIRIAITLAAFDTIAATLAISLSESDHHG